VTQSRTTLRLIRRQAAEPAAPASLRRSYRIADRPSGGIPPFPDPPRYSYRPFPSSQTTGNNRTARRRLRRDTRRFCCMFQPRRFRRLYYRTRPCWDPSRRRRRFLAVWVGDPPNVSPPELPPSGFFRRSRPAIRCCPVSPPTTRRCSPKTRLRTATRPWRRSWRNWRRCFGRPRPPLPTVTVMASCLSRLSIEQMYMLRFSCPRR
jgi:hypothetical protein